MDPTWPTGTEKSGMYFFPFKDDSVIFLDTITGKVCALQKIAMLASSVELQENYVQK